jgi:hypothetical protein
MFLHPAARRESPLCLRPGSNAGAQFPQQPGHRVLQQVKPFLEAALPP